MMMGAMLLLGGLLLAGCMSPARASAATSSVPPSSTGFTVVFPDVPDSHRYARAINELAQLGIVRGRGDGTFGPDDLVCRAQFAKMICGLLGLEVSEGQSYAPFIGVGPDDPGDLYPHEFVGAAYRAGITKGRTATASAPYADITLPQVVTMVVRAADAYYPGLLPTPPRNWCACWPDTDPDHGGNIRRADYSDLLATVPIQLRWADVWRPATRGEVSQVLVNPRNKLEAIDVAVNFENQPLSLTHPVQVATNRYYLPLAELIEQLGGSVTIGDDQIHIAVRDSELVLDLTSSSYTLRDALYPLRNKPLLYDDTLYVSLIDIQRILDHEVVWDEPNSALGLFWKRAVLSETPQPLGGRTALIRFEDITANEKYSTAESLQKLRVVFDYCYAKNILMHMAWVPRYIDPSSGIDNEPAYDYSMHKVKSLLVV